LFILVGQSLYYSFAQSTYQQLIAGSSSATYASLCKISATQILLNNLTRFIGLTSQQYGYQNQ
jgi:hypothetical protein